MLLDHINDYVKNKPSYHTGLTIDDLYRDYVPADFHSDICKMNENENMLGTSPLAVKAMQEAASLCYYYPEGSAKVLREKLAVRYGLTPDNYLITDGAAVALNLIGELFLRPGDEVILPSVTYGAYKNLTARFKGNVITVPVKPDLRFDLDAMLAAVTSRTRLIFICNPNNPTGLTETRGTILGFIKNVPEDVLVVVDEAYFQFYCGQEPCSVLDSICEEHCHTMVIRSFSKLYGMAGARIGYAVSSKEIIWAMREIANYFSANRVGIAGATAALDDLDFETRTLELVRTERTRLTDLFRKWGYTVCESGANFIFVDFRVAPSLLCTELEKYHIFLRGESIFTRISINTREQNDRLLEVLPGVLDELCRR